MRRFDRLDRGAIPGPGLVSVGGVSYLFAPIAWLMGVEWTDCFKVGELLGLRMVTNEMVVDQRMAEWIKPGIWASTSASALGHPDVRVVRVRKLVPRLQNSRS